MCMVDYESKLPINKIFIERNKGMHTNRRLENRLLYLYNVFFQCQVINASTTYKKI